MKIGILINEGPYQHQASDTALQFTKSAIKKGHEIFRVFFYNDGVNNATRLAIPPQDDRNLTKEWSDLASVHNIDLVVCVAAAQRRGLIDAEPFILVLILATLPEKSKASFAEFVNARLVSVSKTASSPLASR